VRRRIYGRRALQPFFAKLYTIGVGGMNYGEFDLRRNGESRLLRRLARAWAERDAVTIVDVGAHEGEYVKEIDRFFDARTTVHAFEPSPTAFARLREVRPARVRLLANALGLSDVLGVMTLHGVGQGDSGSFLHEEGAPLGLLSQLAPSEHQTVPVDTLDAYAARTGIARIDLLKLDTEGHEARVLAGASALLDAGRIEAVQFEFGDRHAATGISFLRLYDLFTKRGYSVARIVKDGLVPLPRYDKNLEIYAGINCLATRTALEGVK
jgi:FkbM family methyltransferase